MTVAGGIALGFAFMFIGIVCTLAIAAGVVTIIGQWKVFEKAGKQGWIALIPVYNTWTLFEISGIKPYFCFFALGGSFLSSFGSVFNQIARDYTPFYVLGLSSSMLSLGLSVAGMVFSIMASLNLAKCFGKSSGFGIGLAFVPFVFYPLLGFSKTDTYTKVENCSF